MCDSKVGVQNNTAFPVALIVLIHEKLIANTGRGRVG